MDKIKSITFNKEAQNNLSKEVKDKMREDRKQAENEQLILHGVRCSVVHCKNDKHDVYIGRPSKWGNPFTHKKDSKTLAKHIVNSREEAVEAYRKWITEGEGKHLLKDLKELNGKTLGCWCSPQSCHGDVLADLVNKHYT